MEHMYFDAQLCINISNFDGQIVFKYIYHSTLANSLSILGPESIWLLQQSHNSPLPVKHEAWTGSKDH